MLLHSYVAMVKQFDHFARKEDKIKYIPDCLEYLVCPYKVSFECLHNFLLISVTLAVTSASCERSFPKIIET